MFRRKKCERKRERAATNLNEQRKAEKQLTVASRPANKEIGKPFQTHTMEVKSQIDYRLLSLIGRRCGLVANPTSPSPHHVAWWFY